MKPTYFATKRKNQFAALPRLAQRCSVATITKDDETVAYVVSREKWESLLETMDLLANPAFQKQWRRLQAGRVKYRSLDDLRD